MQTSHFVVVASAMSNTTTTTTTTTTTSVRLRWESVTEEERDGEAPSRAVRRRGDAVARTVFQKALVQLHTMDGVEQIEARLSLLNR